MKTPLMIATAQFENHSADKTYNLQRIEALTAAAARQGAHVVAFHDCSVTGYTYARDLTREELLETAEPIPDGPATQALIAIARKYSVHLLAGFFEREGNDIYKAQLCVNGDGLVARHRKLHPFINPHILPGDRYTVFDINGWTCGILICYDNNVIENVRATALLGAEILFMPHVTMCTPSPRPGAGFVDASLWQDKEANSKTLREEFDGPKGRSWLMKWLPARAYDNGVYVVFSNPIGMDADQLKNGCSMILDPYGDIIAECRTLGDEVVLAEITEDKLLKAGGYRYRQARKPELYGDILAQYHRSEQRVAWLG